MSQASITLRTDSEFKEQCDALFSKFGISTIAAINIFLHQAVMEQAIPFKIGVREVSPYGGLEDLTDEQIEKNIRDYPYVMGKLKDC
jgi:addiction module RelB/DinJ family antitoxin